MLPCSDFQNPNVTHYDSLLDGEMSSLRGDAHASSRFFESAVVYTGRRGLIQDQALAHERYAEHLSRLGRDHGADAEFHMREAVKLYKEWGAHAKVNQLKGLHVEILSEPTLAPPTSIEIQLEL